MLSRLIWIYDVCKSLLLSPVAVKEFNTEVSEKSYTGSDMSVCCKQSDLVRMDSSQYPRNKF